MCSPATSASGCRRAPSEGARHQRTGVASIASDFATPRPTGTDARAIQMGRGGVATGLVSIPLRYMHTPSEVVDLEDVERCVKLLVEFARALKKGDYAHW